MNLRVGLDDVEKRKFGGEGLGQSKIPITSSGIEPVTFRLVT
jgi:hypothetical protein